MAKEHSAIRSNYPGEDTSTDEWKKMRDAMYTNMSEHEFYDPADYWGKQKQNRKENGTVASRTLEEYFPCLDDGCCDDDIQPDKLREAFESLQYALAKEASAIARKHDVDPVIADRIHRDMLEA